MAIKYIPRDEYKGKMENMLQRYENAGLTHADCLVDFSNGKGEVCYADGAVAGGIALIIGGLICKWLAGKEARKQASEMSGKLAYYASIKPLTDFKVPADDDREENND